MLRYLPRRGKAAFLMSCDELFAQSKLIGRNVYFWTFTWEKPMAYWCYHPSWRRFVRMLVADYTSEDFAALRVWERHPQGHGLHVHMLCNERLNVNLMRRLALHAGLGIVLHVRKAVDTDAQYLAKYMTKDGKIPGVRQWAKLGNWEHVKCAELTFESEDVNAFRYVNAVMRERGLNKGQAYNATRAYLAQLSRDKAWSDEENTFGQISLERLPAGVSAGACNTPK